MLFSYKVYRWGGWKSSKKIFFQFFLINPFPSQELSVGWEAKIFFFSPNPKTQIPRKKTLVFTHFFHNLFTSILTQHICSHSQKAICREQEADTCQKKLLLNLAGKLLWKKGQQISSYVLHPGMNDSYFSIPFFFQETVYFAPTTAACVGIRFWIISFVHTKEKKSMYELTEQGKRYTPQIICR